MDEAGAQVVAVGVTRQGPDRAMTGMLEVNLAGGEVRCSVAARLGLLETEP